MFDGKKTITGTYTATDAAQDLKTGNDTRLFDMISDVDDFDTTTENLCNHVLAYMGGVSDWNHRLHDLLTTAAINAAYDAIRANKSKADTIGDLTQAYYAEIDHIRAVAKAVGVELRRDPVHQTRTI